MRQWPFNTYGWIIPRQNKLRFLEGSNALFYTKILRIPTRLKNHERDPLVSITAFDSVHSAQDQPTFHTSASLYEYPPPHQIRYQRRLLPAFPAFALVDNEGRAKSIGTKRNDSLEQTEYPGQ